MISCSGFLYSDLLSCRGSPVLRVKSDTVSCRPSGNSDSTSCMRSIGKSIKFRLHFVRRSPPVPTCLRASTLLRRGLPHRPPASASAVRETNPLHFVGLFSPWTPVVVIFCPDTTSKKNNTASCEACPKSSCLPAKKPLTGIRPGVSSCTPPRRNSGKQLSSRLHDCKSDYSISQQSRTKSRRDFEGMCPLRRGVSQ